MSRDTKKKKFDCVQYTREVRTQLQKETAHMTAEERVAFYRNQTYANPVLARLAAMSPQRKER